MTHLLFRWHRQGVLAILIPAQRGAGRAIGRLPERPPQYILRVQVTNRRPAVVQITARTVQTRIRRGRILLPVAPEVLDVLERQPHDAVRVITNHDRRGAEVATARRLLAVVGEAAVPTAVRILRVRVDVAAADAGLPVEGTGEVLGFDEGLAGDVAVVHRAAGAVGAEDGLGVFLLVGLLVAGREAHGGVGAAAPADLGLLQGNS